MISRFLGELGLIDWEGKVLGWIMIMIIIKKIDEWLVIDYEELDWFNYYFRVFKFNFCLIFYVDKNKEGKIEFF